LDLINGDLLSPRGRLGGSLRILVGCWRFPAGLLEGELHGDGLAVLADDVGASLHSSVLEERSGLVHLSLPELFLVVQRAVSSCDHTGAWSD